MSAVAVEITPRPSVSLVPATGDQPTTPEPAGLVIVDDVESLTEGTVPGCNDDNPYR